MAAGTRGRRSQPPRWRRVSGDAMRWFPHGIVVGFATEGLCAKTVEDATPLRADWKLFGNYLCAWIWDSPPPGGSGR